VSSSTDRIRSLTDQSDFGILFELEAPVDFQTGIRPISYVKTHAAEMLEQINESQNPIVITQNGQARGVLLDTRSYQQLIDAIGILKLISHSERDLEADRTMAHEVAIQRARQSIDNR
jgi:PHD/YefM family antitoxin component YafN of YafNO toxin-antitoxin module